MADRVEHLINTIARVGRAYPMHPPLHLVEPFVPFFLPNGRLRQLDRLEDDSCTRREMLLRYLLLSAVAGQGVGSDGAIQLLANFTNYAYHRKIRFLTQPSALLSDLEVVVAQFLRALDSMDVLPERFSSTGEHRPCVQDAKRTLSSFAPLG